MKRFSQIYILLLLFVTTKTYSQQCLTTGGCTNFVTPYPTSGAPYSPPTSWQVLKNPATGNDALFNAGNYTKFTVVSGNTYEWTYCEDYGGLSTSWDAQLTLYNEVNLSSPLCFSTDVCGTNSNNAPYIRWTANFNGTVRLLTTAYSGIGCLSNSGSPYNKLAYKQTAGSGCTTPGTPSNAIGIATGQTTASLSWSSGNPTGSPTVTYYWTVSTSSNGSGVVDQGSTTNTSTSASGLSCNTAYYLRVYAFTSCNNSTSSYFTSTAFTTASCNSSNLLQGIDVSHWQGTINWTTVANTNVKFAYIKATEGFTGVDSKFNFNITNAVNTNIKVGAYHLARPENNSASNEVDNFLNIAGNYTGIGYLPPLLDLEQAYAQAYIDQGNTWSQLAQWLNDWCTQIYSIKNRWPVLYADRCRAASLYSSYQNGTINSNVKLMIADYSNNAGSPNNYPGCNWVGWPWLFHQYSETGTVSGINGNVDLDVFNGDMTALSNLINGGSTPTATLNSFTIAPTTVCPGNSFTISNSITASAAMSNVILGASIRLASTSTIIDNTANDITISLTSGSNTKTRNFTVPIGTANGTYDVISAVWKDNNNNGLIDAGDIQLSSKTNTGPLTVSSSSCCSDNYEPNNSSSTSTAFFTTPLFITATCNTEYSYIGSGDQDWYRIPVDGTGTLKIDLTSLPKDYDIELYLGGGCSGSLSGGALNTSGQGYNSGTTSESITYTHGIQVSTCYYVKVCPKNTGVYDLCDSYRLEICWQPSVACTSPNATVNDVSGTGSVNMTCSTSGGSGGTILYKWYSGTSCSGTVLGTNPTYTATTSGNYACKAYVSGNESTCYSCDYGYAIVNAACSTPTSPTTCTNSIGSPANGLQHHINQTWSSVIGAVGYEYQYSWDGNTYQNGNPYQTSSTNIDWNLSDQPNQIFYTRVRTYKCTNPVQYSSWTYGNTNPIYTACDEPAIPTANNPAANSLNIALNTESPVANPSYTTYAIYCTTTAQYVQSNGALGSLQYYQTKANWGTKTVIGLSTNTTYCFYALAKNMNGDIRYNSSNIACATTTNTTCTAPSAPSSCTNSIGSPSNGLQHHINQTWSSVIGVVGYEYQYSWDGNTYQNGNPYQTSSTNIDWNLSDQPNQIFYTRVRAYKCTSPVQYSSWTYGNPNPIYTACDEPATPLVINYSTATSVNVTINVESPVDNPSYTTYAIYCTTTNRYVQSNGTLGTSPYYQTKANWGSKTVIGLSANTTYCFYALAKNMNGDIRYNSSNIDCATTLNVTSIINSITNDKFKIYPNPNSGEFILEMDLNKSGNCQIIITNILGQKVYEETRFVSKEKNKIPIQLSIIANGTYNVSIIVDKENYQKQIIITK